MPHRCSQPQQIRLLADTATTATLLWSFGGRRFHPMRVPPAGVYLFSVNLPARSDRHAVSNPHQRLSMPSSPSPARVRFFPDPATVIV